MTITIFSLFILYTIACIMDGQDVKPLWKKWLGSKLIIMANRLWPIRYCNYNLCGFYKDAVYNLPMVREQYQQLLKNISMMNALDARPKVFISEYDIKNIEQGFILGESELYEARMHEEIAKRNGIQSWQIPPMMTVDGIVLRTKERCMDSISDAVKPFITIEEDRESHFPDIIVRGTLHVGVKRKGLR